MPKLTAASVEQAKPGRARRELPDALCPGLYLVIQPEPSGRKSWAVRFRFAGKSCKLTLGPYSDALGLVAARDLARAALRAVAAGRDPHAEKVEARRLKEIEATRQESGERTKGTDSFASAWTAFERDHIDATLRSSTADEWKRIYKNTLAPRWKKRKLAEVERADVRALQRALRDTPAAADKALAVVRAFFNWLIREHEALTVSPCANVQKVKLAKDEQAEDDRTLTDAEIRWAWAACGEVGYPFGGIVRMLLLTGARRNEVAELPRSELDIDDRAWKLPAVRAKNGHAHTIYLSDLAVTVLDSLPRIAESLFVFSHHRTEGKRPSSGFSKAKKALDAAMLKIARKERTDVTIEPWHLHSLRKTFATGLARLQIPQHITDRCLNHVKGGKRDSPVSRIYNRYEYADEQRAAFDAWGRHVMALVSGQDTGNLVPLATRLSAVANAMQL